MKKRIFSLVLALCMTLALLPAKALAAPTSSENWLDGLSVVTDTWDRGGDINTAEELAQFCYNVNHEKNYDGQVITLTADIDLSGKLWTPIGSKPTESTSTLDNDWEFSGSFDGGGHTISNVSIVDDSRAAVGLFGLVAWYGKATPVRFIKDIVIENLDINAQVGDHSNSVSGGIGGLAGFMRGTGEISGCSINGSINTSGITDVSLVGGLVGNVWGTVESEPYIFDDCSTSVAINSTASYCAGLVGYLRNCAVVTGCFSTGDIVVDSGASDPTVGGLIADVTVDSHMVIENCYSLGDITVSTTGSVAKCGGFVGNSSNGEEIPIEIKGCFSSGDVLLTSTLDTTLFAGGFSGGFGGNDELVHVSDSYCTGDVTTVGVTALSGGFAGTSKYLTATNCYTTGRVSATGTALSRAFGFVSNNSENSTYENCFALGDKMDNSTAVNPFVSGSADKLVVTNSGYYKYMDLRNITPKALAEGLITYSPSELRAIETYSSFSDTVWGKVDGKLPILSALPEDVQIALMPELLSNYEVSYAYSGNIPATAVSAPSTKPAASGTEITVESAPTASGYIFSGWSTTDVSVLDGKFTMPAKDVAFTGSWATTGGTADTTLYSLTFQTNGGSEISPMYERENTVINLVQLPTKEGYTFNGWFRDAALTEKISSIKLTSSSTVYAGWTTVTPGTKFSFIDVPLSHWGLKYIESVYEKGILSGLSETIFAPENSTTRAMLWTALAHTKNISLDPNIDWRESSQSWAITAGISDGISPNENVTREQIATTLYRLAGSPGSAEITLAEFSDAGKVSDWAQAAMLWSVDKGIILGRGDGTLDPVGSATRAELSAVIVRYLSLAQ